MRDALHRALQGTAATLLLFVAAVVWVLALYEATDALALSFALGVLIAFGAGIFAARR